MLGTPVGNDTLSPLHSDMSSRWDLANAVEMVSASVSGVQLKLLQAQREQLRIY